MGHRQFLVIDDNADSRFLLVKTLLRKFPQAMVRECQDSDVAVATVKKKAIHAVIVHRAADADGITLIGLLRQANPSVPVVWVSGVDRNREARAAGATAFLNYDEWLRIGTVVSEILSPEDPTAGTATALEDAR